MVFDLLTLTSNARGHLLEKQHARCCSLCWFWFDSFRHVPTCSILWFLLFRNLQAGGMAVLLLAMPTKLWSLDRKRMWTHILVPALLKLLTSCYTTVFLQFSTTFRFQSDEVWSSFDLSPSPFDEFRFKSVPFRRISIHFFGFWTSLWRTYELRSSPWRSTTLGPCSK